MDALLPMPAPRPVVGGSLEAGGGRSSSSRSSGASSPSLHYRRVLSPSPQPMSLLPRQPSPSLLPSQKQPLIPWQPLLPTDRPGLDISEDIKGPENSKPGGAQVGISEQLKGINALCQTGTGLLQKGRNSLASKYFHEALETVQKLQVCLSLPWSTGACERMRLCACSVGSSAFGAGAQQLDRILLHTADCWHRSSLKYSFSHLRQPGHRWKVSWLACARMPIWNYTTQTRVCSCMQECGQACLCMFVRALMY